LICYHIISIDKAMKNIYLIIFIVIFAFIVGYIFGQTYRKTNLNPLISNTPLKTYPLKKYSIQNLKKTKFFGKQIQIKEELNSTDSFTSYQYFSYDDSKRVSGLINIPKQVGEYPIAILLRGYVDKEIYTSGIGTQRVGEFLAQNGYITIAPDFLGYGKSDKPSKDGLEERFQTYTTTLELLASLNSVNSALIEKGISDITANPDNVVIWGHSNGGHIALAALVISGKNYPTVLWAPVSKPFPYSILYYTDQYTDRGKYLRKLLADFETDYDIEKYNPINYLKSIKAPIQIHQGTMDEDVPVTWSNELNSKLNKFQISVDYFVYENADHNLVPDGWSRAVSEMFKFYNDKVRK